MTLYNFPAQPTPFIGRDEELAQITALLASDTCRLLTLVGPGGMGKTRLAIEAAQAQADRFADGVYFVALQPLASSDHLLSAIAQALDVQFSPDHEPKAQLLDMLRLRSALLLLDNVEHLLDGVDLFAECLAAAPGLKLITTSRERLNLVEEWVFDVGGLTVPEGETLEEVARFSAVELFVRGAQRVDRSFSLANEWTHVVRICQLVDGMPLALEQASAWVRALPCAEIVQELERSLDILETAVRNVMPRHRNMRAVLDYSWGLLADDERRTFARLSVFRGGFMRDAAEAVAEASRHTLIGLVDKSWLQYSSETGRYDIHELLRQYGQEQLDATSADARDTHERHCDYYMTLLRTIWPRMSGADFPAAGAEIEVELDNIRAGWTWAVQTKRFDALEGTLQSLWFYYDRGSRFQEGERVFAKAANALEDEGYDFRSLYAQVLSRQAAMLFSLDRFVDARALLQESIPILRETGPRDALAFALLEIGMTLLEANTDIGPATDHFCEALDIYRGLGDVWGEAYTNSWLCIAHAILAEQVEPISREALSLAAQYANEALAQFQRLGSAWGIAMVKGSMAMLAYYANDFQQAWQMGYDALQLYTEVGVHWGRANAYHTLADTAFLLGRYDQARQHVADGLRVSSSYRLMKFSLFLVYTLAEIELAEGHQEWAYELLAFVDQQRNRYSHPRYAVFEYDDKLAAAVTGPYRAAVERGRSHDIDTFLRVLIDRLSGKQAGAVPPASTPAPAMPNGGELLSPLTERELDVLRLLANGLSNRQIADALVLALGTVKTHVHNICGKLGAASRTEAIARARDLSLI